MDIRENCQAYQSKPCIGLVKVTCGKGIESSREFLTSSGAPWSDMCVLLGIPHLELYGEVDRH